MSRRAKVHRPDAVRMCPRCSWDIPVRDWWAHGCVVVAPEAEPATFVLTPPPEGKPRRIYVLPTPLAPARLAALAKDGKACARCSRLLAPGAVCECGDRSPQMGIGEIQLAHQPEAIP